MSTQQKKSTKVRRVANINGDISWRNEDGVLHREDGPAIECANGDKFWYINGKGHREDGPAVEFADGTKKWYKNGVLHRLDGPAVEHSNGDKEWYKEGNLHREDGPAIERTDGINHWYKNGVGINDMTNMTNTMGRKNDQGKDRWGLLLEMKAAHSVVEILSYGAKKYAPRNYKYVKGWRWRYSDAAIRHFYSWISGEELDPETKKPHLAHAICCLLMLLDNELTKQENGDDEGK